MTRREKQQMAAVLAVAMVHRPGYCPLKPRYLSNYSKYSAERERVKGVPRWDLGTVDHAGMRAQ